VSIDIFEHWGSGIGNVVVCQLDCCSIATHNQWWLTWNCIQ